MHIYFLLFLFDRKYQIIVISIIIILLQSHEIKDKVFGN